MTVFTKEEFTNHLGEDSIKHIFPIEKIFDIIRIRLDLMLNPNVAMTLMQFVQIKKGVEKTYFALKVMFWLDPLNNLEVTAKIHSIIHYSSLKEAIEQQEIVVKNELKINQN